MYGIISGFNEQVRRIVISGAIKEEMAALFLEQLTAMAVTDPGKAISIYIDTYGGVVDSAMLMYDAMKNCECPLYTIGIGKVMSAGVLLLAAGDPDKRLIAPNARIMLHQVSGGTIGTLAEMEDAIAETKNTQKRYNKLLSKEIGVSIAQINKDIERKDFYMSAMEAINYGIADRLWGVKKKPDSKNEKESKTKKRTVKKRVAKPKQ